MEKLLLTLGGLAALQAPAAKVVSVGREEIEVKVVALGPCPTRGFSKTLKDMNIKEVSTAYADDGYKAPTMRSNIKKGRR